MNNQNLVSNILDKIKIAESVKLRIMASAILYGYAKPETMANIAKDKNCNIYNASIIYTLGSIKRLIHQNKARNYTQAIEIIEEQQAGNSPYYANIIDNDKLYNIPYYDYYDIEKEEEEIDYKSLLQEYMIEYYNGLKPTAQQTIKQTIENTAIYGIDYVVTESRYSTNKKHRSLWSKIIHLFNNFAHREHCGKGISKGLQKKEFVRLLCDYIKL